MKNEDRDPNIRVAIMDPNYALLNEEDALRHTYMYSSGV